MGVTPARRQARRTIADTAPLIRELVERRSHLDKLLG